MTGNSVRSKLTGKMVFVLFGALVMLLAACGGGGTTPGTNAPKTTTLRMVAAPGQSIPDLFNPYFNNNGGSDVGAQGLLFETLYYTNLYNGKTAPWLASSYTYSSDLTQLTFNLRTDVKWSDGQPFTSADVKYTFDAMQANKSLDQNGIFASTLKSVAAPDDHTVVFTLLHPDSTALFHIGDQVFIVPQHVWSKQTGDLSKFTNDQNPVGTGPYTLKSFNQSLLTYTANPSYWGTKPAVQTIEIPSIKDNTTAITAMVSGHLDWMGTGWSPDFDNAFTKKDPTHNHTWFAPSNTVNLYLNLTHAPFNDLLVRKAISAAINRDGLPTGVAQYAKVTNITGVIPSFSQWISSAYQNQAFEYGADKAAAYLTQAGYTLNGKGFYAKGGKELAFQVDVPGAWSDWAQDVQNIVQDLQKAHINATTNFLSGYTPYYTAISTGAYDAALSWTNSGSTPYFDYQGLLQSSNGVGKVISGTNFERWNAQTGGQFAAQIDADLAKYEGTADQATQIAAIQDIEKIAVEQLPVLPLTANVAWDEYTTTNWIGWPTQDNPYSYGSPYTAPDFEMVILQLKPAA
ncbi:MAG TPA: ABC transporter substrate-binding protein [Ktedonobacteraceae bacterium]